MNGKYQFSRISAICDRLPGGLTEVNTDNPHIVKNPKAQIPTHLELPSLTETCRRMPAELDSAIANTATNAKVNIRRIEIHGNPDMEAA